MSTYRVTFWRHADETEAPILIITPQADSASHALYETVNAFIQLGWDGDIDHVSVKKLNGKP